MAIGARLLGSAGLLVKGLAKRGVAPAAGNAVNARFESSGFRGRTTPLGPYGGLNVKEEAAKMTPDRLEALGATGEGTPVYEQFVKDRIAARTKFLAENKMLVNQSHDIEVIKKSDGGWSCIDGNQAAAHIAYALSDVSFIYPITPSSAMGEMIDEWAAKGLKNCFDQPVTVTEMQSEGGAAGALHGALKAGALASSYTASQGLLLMIPNMYKIAGELLPCVLHVSARTLCAHALNIFGDHSDVMATRSTGWVMLASESPQMVMDHALISHLATLEMRQPVLHFFDGFRTSHEVNKVKLIDYDQIKPLIPWDAIKAHHDVALSPVSPHIQGTNQGPDVFFQCAEAANPIHAKIPSYLDKWADKVAELTGRRYGDFAYEGHPEAEQVVVAMGSGAVTLHEVVKHLNAQGRKVGVLKVRLFRPWLPERFLAALPASVKRLAVLDRVKEVGALGEPLFVDVCATLHQAKMDHVDVVGGRFGLGGKDFTPGMALAVYDNLAAAKPKRSFTVGINDDVTNLSLSVKEEIDVLPKGTIQCLLYGLGSDGTVGANKTAIKLIATHTDSYAQGYFEYDSKKSGGLTVSHLRFGPSPIHAPYLVKNADYIGIHKETYLQRLDITRNLKMNGTLVINCQFGADRVEEMIPDRVKYHLATRNAKLYLINGAAVGAETGVGKRINMVMQTIFFKLSGVMPVEKAIKLLEKEVDKMYGKKGEEIVKMNIAAIHKSVDRLVHIPIPAHWAKVSEAPRVFISRAAKKTAGARAYSTSVGSRRNFSTTPARSFSTSSVSRSPVDDNMSCPSRAASTSATNASTAGSEHADQIRDFVEVIADPVNRFEGNDLPVSAFEAGGRVPTGSSEFEKRGIALRVPKVDMDKCTQCNYCSLICPHAAVRPFLATKKDLEAAPESFRKGSRKAIGGGALDNYNFRIQVSPLDCTGCELCVRICPSDALSLDKVDKVVEAEEANWEFAVTLPNHGEEFDKTTVKGSQFQQPYLEFSGACEGCGETPYVKLLTQLLGDRLVVANATGCSSIWGASYPSFPYTTNSRGEGPAWANSLFEDNAEFGLGMRRAFKQRRHQLMLLVDDALADTSVPISDKLRKLLNQFSVMRHEDKADMLLPKGRSFYNQLREKIVPLLTEEAGKHPKLQKLYDQSDMFGRHSHWIIGGDGWAYDIGFGGLDHVLASEEHVNVLVLDTEMYSNTGGQASKSTPLGARAKFAETGKLTAKKDLGQYAMTYKNVYVASICIHANHQQAVRAILEAEAYPGPSIVICYSPCISQGFPMAESIQHCKEAVESGYWPLYRYNPQLAEGGNNPFQLDSKTISGDLFKFLSHENRFAAIMRRSPIHAQQHQQRLHQQLDQRVKALNVLSLDELPSSLRAAAPAEKITVLYGSETGNAEEQAKSLYEGIKARGLSATISSLNDFEFEELPKQSTVVVVISTCGQGEFPANSHKFWKKLQNPTLPMSFLDGVKFTVFGLGDSTYSLFCVAAESIDVRLAELGASRVLNRGIGDDRDEDRYYTGWDNWLPQLWKALHAPDKPLVRVIPKPAFEVEYSKGDATPAVSNDTIVPAGATPLTLTENSLLTPEKYDRDIRHYVFNIKDTSVSYNVGDVLAIYPRNHSDQVDAFCKMYGLDPTQEMRITAKPEARNRLPEECNVRQLFQCVLDIFGKPNRVFFDNLSLYATDPAEKAKLELMTSEDPEGKAMFRELANDLVNHADVLRMFPSARPPLEQLMNMIPCIKPRSYSIASAPNMHPDEIELCIVAVDWEVPSTKEKRFGQCTSYLITTKPGDVVMCAVKPSSIVLPDDPKKPVIMAGMGTGLAPWRALTQHRVFEKQQGVDVGPCVIFYGARKAATEYLYKEEFDKYAKLGVLEMHTAFSRDQARKIYVQTRIAEQYKLVYKYLMEDGGSFYVCGSSRNVPEDIYNAMKEVMMKGGNLDEPGADAALSSLKMDGRYTVEAWS